MGKKIKKEIEWPESVFTIQEVMDANPKFKPITLRVRMTKEKEERVIEEIGYINTGKGRPKLLFTKAPITEDDINTVKNKGGMLKEGLQIEVVNIAKPTTNMSPTIDGETDKELVNDVIDAVDKKMTVSM